METFLYIFQFKGSFYFCHKMRSFLTRTVSIQLLGLMRQILNLMLRFCDIGLTQMPRQTQLEHVHVSSGEQTLNCIPSCLVEVQCAKAACLCRQNIHLLYFPIANKEITAQIDLAFLCLSASSTNSKALYDAANNIAGLSRTAMVSQINASYYQVVVFNQIRPVISEQSCSFASNFTTLATFVSFWT